MVLTTSSSIFYESVDVPKQRVSPNSILTSSVLSYIDEVGTKKVYVSSVTHSLLIKFRSPLNFSGSIISFNFHDLSEPSCNFSNSVIVKSVALALEVLSKSGC
ncbi:hypothetical protein ES043_15035 [Polaribacter sp. IC063]|nr:hypothetical protein ES043_15035 [Polaribacter sp. IC063]